MSIHEKNDSASWKLGGEAVELPTIRVTSANYSRMAEMVSPYNKTLSDPSAMGEWTTESIGGVARFAREINRQAAMIGYTNAFVLYTAVSAVAIPLVLMLGGRKRTAS